MRLTGDDLPATELAQLRQTFEAFVDSQNGLADTIALKKALLATAFVQDNGSELYPVILELDRKNGSKITFQEFIEIFAADSNLLQFQLPLNPQTAQRMFRLIETDQKDRIGYADLRRLAEELGEPLTAEEIHEMIQRADTDGDGYVDARRRPFREIKAVAPLQADFARMMNTRQLWSTAGGSNRHRDI